jgi:adenylate cyclase
MRVTRAFSFVDLCGFTAYVELRGEEATLSLLSRLRSAARGAAEAHGVRVVKWLGDGAMLTAVHSAPLVECVLQLRDTLAETSPLALRAGIAHGEVIVFEGDEYVGSVVNIAARLTRRAAPNQVLATEAVAAEVVELVRLRPLSPLRVDGSSRAVAIRELLSFTRKGELPIRAAIERSVR